MVEFVNAKINIGLQVVARREDGYHDLQTLFYPVGLYAGTPGNPVEFCDILEIVPVPADSIPGPFTLVTSGRRVDCPQEKNLVWRAAQAYFSRGVADGFAVSIRLDKHLPDGAGMGGGSADAAFTLRMLADLEREYAGTCAGESELHAMALRLGADCPFFLLNRPAYAEGVGEKLADVPLDLSGRWLLVVKPDVYVSTREAFAGITPRPAAFDLRGVASLPVEQWCGKVHNDFEDSIFALHPFMAGIKQALYDSGALYASLTGSGSCIYGIYDVPPADPPLPGPVESTYLLQL